MLCFLLIVHQILNRLRYRQLENFERVLNTQAYIKNPYIHARSHWWYCGGFIAKFQLDSH